jgi:hypothetical protein
MKRFYRSIFFSTFLFPFYCSAQQQQLAGFVFANAIGINEKADVTANGKRVTRKGLDAGWATSGLGLPVGNYEVQVTAPGCESAKASVVTKMGTTPVVVAYLERRNDPRTNVLKNFIRLFQLPAEPQEQKYLIKVISVDPTARFNATASGQTQPLQLFRPAVFENKTVKIIDANGATQDATVDEKGSYYCFVFHKADGKPATCLVPERIYQW